MRGFSNGGIKMNIYYQTAHIEEGDTYATLTAHDTIEEAIAFAEAHGCTTICEIGGSWDEFEKCGFCGEWLPAQDLDEGGWCRDCNWYVKYGRG
jgi:hypothetical protein